MKRLLIVTALLAGLASSQPNSRPGDMPSGHDAAEEKDRVPTEKGAEACKEDIERVCKDVKPGGGRVGACLAEKASGGGLSASCERWADHGGRSHRAEALRSEIDGAPGR